MSKRGRPAKPWDYDRVTKLRAIGCTDREIAGVLGVSASTFSKRKKSDPQLEQALDNGEVQQKVNVRAWTFQAAARLHWKALEHLNHKLFPEEQPERHVPAASEVPVGVVLPVNLTAAAYRVVMEDMRARGLLPGDGEEVKEVPVFAAAALTETSDVDGDHEG